MKKRHVLIIGLLALAVMVILAGSGCVPQTPECRAENQSPGLLDQGGRPIELEVEGWSLVGFGLYNQQGQPIELELVCLNDVTLASADKINESTGYEFRWLNGRTEITTVLPKSQVVFDRGGDGQPTVRFEFANEIWPGLLQVNECFESPSFIRAVISGTKEKIDQLPSCSLGK